MVTITVCTAGSPPNESVGGGETCSFLLPVSSIIGQLPLLVYAVYSDVPALTILAVLLYFLFLVYGVCECD